MKIISVDFQRDFSAEDGGEYRSRPSTVFLKNIFFPFIRSKEIRIAEIVSDYRLPRPGDDHECCVPGKSGYESEVPADIKSASIWIKCMNSPDWTRDNAGRAELRAGLPRPDPMAFTNWLAKTIGPAPDSVVLVGLTLDCCVLATAQALAHRAYKVFYLAEGVDTYSGDTAEKEFLFRSAALNWGKVLTWNELQDITIRSSQP